MRARFIRALIAFLSIVALAGCGIGERSARRAADDVEASARPGGRSRHLAATPAPEASLPPQTDAPSSGSTSSPLERADPDASAENVPWHSVISLQDASGDAGDAPDYGDVVGLDVDGDGKTARFIVTLAGDAPDELADREVIGLGIDLGPPGAEEGTYQLFADGGSHGWTAYLYAVDRFVKYEGRFVVEGNRIGFEVPWSAIGNLREGSIGLFCDWSARELVLGKASADHLPDRERRDYRL